MKITIAGASGFVGLNLIKKLDSAYSIKGLSRSAKTSNIKNLTWAEVDLFSLGSTVHALEETDIAIYLVHSMMPSSRLFQGNFQDTDLLLADNFAKACQKAKVKQIIYLGGLVPEKGGSKHLTSRKEVEEVLKFTNIPITILRAGMVVGDGGSSFEILKNLVLNLPIMILPKWTKSRTQVIFVDDLISVIIKSINNESFYNKTINVVNGERFIYKDLIQQTIEHFGKKKIIFPIPIYYTRFSKLWVKNFGQTDYELVSPLIDSLMCDLPWPPIEPLIFDCIKYKNYREMLKVINPKKLPRNRSKAAVVEKAVRSIQRLPNIYHLSNETILIKYVQWLPLEFKYLIKAFLTNDGVCFNFLGFKKPLLILKKIEEIESVDRLKFHITGGLLSKTTDTGWLEFRQISGGEFTLASIHGFIPSLPWYIYKYTQAPMHEYVMKKFGDFISRKDK